MRVISGERKGYILKTSKLVKARPTEDRIKEALFNLLQPLESEATVLDLFAGTGSIGIEFLSRGCQKVYFGDIRHENIRCIHDNLIKTGYEDKSVVIQGDFRRMLRWIAKDGSLQFDYIFLDPPYKSQFYKDAIDLINRYQLLRENGILIIESQEHLSMEDVIPLCLIKKRKYGRIELSLYQRGDWQ